MIKIDDAIEPIQKLYQQIEQNQWKIGEILSTVETVRGEKTLSKISEKSGVPFSTLKLCKYVYDKWKDLQRPKELPGQQ
jgi:hypothetical protein